MKDKIYESLLFVSLLWKDAQIKLMPLPSPRLCVGATAPFRKSWWDIGVKRIRGKLDPYFLGCEALNY